MRDEELALLAALMQRPGPILELELSSAEFSTADGSALFSAMQALAQQGVTVDPLTLGEHGVDRRLIADVYSASAAVSNIPHYVKRVKLEARRRRLQEAARYVLESKDDPDALADHLLSQLAVETGDRHLWDMGTLMQRSLANAAEAREMNRRGEVVGIRSGWRRLDRFLGGLRGGRLYVVGGRPKMGKTSWALGLQVNAARAGATVGFASTEMAAEECGARWLACTAGVDATSIQQGDLTDEEESRLAQASSRLAQLPIHVLDRAGVTPGRIRRQCIAWQQRYGLDLLVVDYLQRLSPDAKGERRDLTVGEMARSFKTLARDLDIPVVLLVQLTRKPEERDDKRPIPSDMRDSGEIEQEADVVGFLYRDAVYNEDADPCLAEFLIRANRHGPAGVARLSFEPKFQRWLDLDMHNYEAAA